MANVGEASDLGGASDDTPNGPIDGHRDRGHGRGQGGHVMGNVSRWQLLKSHDAPGQLQHGLDEIVEGVEPGFQRARVLHDHR